MNSPISLTLTGTAVGDFPKVQVGYTCPVCGFILSAPPQDFLICVSCGTEFGNDDADWSHAELRSAWMDDGFKWFSNSTPPPNDWDPIAQVAGVIPLTGGRGAETTEEIDRWADFRVTATASSEVTCRD